VISVNPIDVCVKTGPLTSCAPFNTVHQNGLPLSQNSTTNPIGFVYSYTNTAGATVYIDLTRAILNQIGVDVAWGKMVQYISPVINTSTGQTYQTLNVVTSNCGLGTGPATGFQSCDLLNLSQQPCISHLPTTPNPSPACPTSPLSTTPSTHNMFFVQSLNPPSSQAGSQIYDLSWVKANGVAIAANTFFPPAPLTPFIDVLAHGLMHNLCCDHTSFGAGPYNPIMVDPNGGALQTTPAGVTVGECDSGYPACAANLLTIGNLRTESTVNCLAVSNPPLPGETACAAGTPSLYPVGSGTAAQMTTEAQQWSGLPLSQQGAPLDCSGFLVPIPSSTATVSWSPPSNSMTVTLTGAVSNSPCGVVSGVNYNLLASVFVAPGTLQFNKQNPTIISQSPRNLLQDIDWPVGDTDNNGPGSTYALGSLMSLCSTSTPQCLITEFNLPGAGTTSKGTAQITFTKGFTTSLTAGELCGAKVAFIFSHGYMTTSQLTCANSTSNTATASSQSPDLTAPAAAQIVNTTAFATATASNPGCSLSNGACSTDPSTQGVYDGNANEEPQLCYSGGVLVKC
jgi:hypothetical protein